MLRSRVDNRPNSSVTDFRRQLSKLQNTATPTRGAVRAMGRPLAPSPLNRPAAGGRPSRAHHRQSHLRHSETPSRAPRPAAATEPARRFRSHGDASGAQERPTHAHHRQTHMNPRQAAPAPAAAGADVRRRRTNVLFVLVITAACTLFLAVTTSSTVSIYLFALAFLSLCGYVFLLAQTRQRSSSEWDDGWLEQR